MIFISKLNFDLIKHCYSRLSHILLNEVGFGQISPLNSLKPLSVRFLKLVSQNTFFSFLLFLIPHQWLIELFLIGNRSFLCRLILGNTFGNCFNRILYVSGERNARLLKKELESLTNDKFPVLSFWLQFYVPSQLSRSWCSTTRKHFTN